MNYLMSVLLLVLALGSNAQDDNRKRAAMDFKAVNEAYINSDKLKMDVNYALFPSYTATAAFEKAQGVYMKDGNSTYSCLLGIVSLTNSRVAVTLDSNEQAIVITDPPDKKDRNPSLVDIDTLLSICSSIEFKEMPAGLKFYKLKFEGVLFSEYNAIEVYIDSKTNFLSRITLYYRGEMDLNENDDVYTRDKPRLEIVYTHVTTDPVFAQDQFSESKMITAKGRSFIVSPAYSNYRLINHKIR